jgi:hypothetical protein
MDTRPYPLASFGMCAICSLDNNQLSGVNWLDAGTFTLDAINAICDALTKSSVQSIR